MNLLLHTEPCDLHAIAVACILREKKHDVTRCIGIDFPSHEKLSLRHEPGARAFTLRWETRADGEVDPRESDVVWYRRPRGIKLPVDLHPADIEYALNECTEAYRGFVFSSNKAFWVNPLSSQAYASNKVLQLQIASAVGFDLPDTLVSNSADDVKHFVGQAAEVIYKPLRGASWLVEGKVHGTYTTPITAADLPSARMLEACPGIYQKLVQKQYEVRAQFFGQTCLAIKIDSMKMEYGKYDWRRNQLAAIPDAEAIVPPQRVVDSCLEMMRRLDIVSGAFDFIVDTDGDWIFLEVNPAGQFAFIERWCPELPVMDIFCDFLLSCDCGFQSARRAGRTRLGDVMASDAFKAMMAGDLTLYHKSDIGRRAVEDVANHQQEKDVSA